MDANSWLEILRCEVEARRVSQGRKKCRFDNGNSIMKAN
jgi:hypothetical protein